MKNGISFVTTLALVGFAVWVIILVATFAYWVGF